MVTEVTVLTMALSDGILENSLDGIDKITDIYIVLEETLIDLRTIYSDINQSTKQPSRQLLLALYFFNRSKAATIEIRC